MSVFNEGPVLNIDSFDKNDYNLIKDYSKFGLTLAKKMIDTYGFWAILISASYPNMFFDMLGVVCGYYNYPFWGFFKPTLIGKSLIKAPVQVLVISYLANYGEEYLESLTDYANDESWVATIFNGILAYYFLRMLVNGLANEYRNRTIMHIWATRIDVQETRIDT